MAERSYGKSGYRSYRATVATTKLGYAFAARRLAIDGAGLRLHIEEHPDCPAADEAMIASNVYDHTEPLRSYERLADVFEVAAPGKRTTKAGSKVPGAIVSPEGK